jgi:CO/xanthine dehydrogenase Mo-binding subunit
VQDLVFECGRIRSRDRALDRAHTELTDTLGDGTVGGGGQRTPLSSEGAVQTWGCQIAQVAVDPGIGAVIVEKIVAVHDVGRIITPLTASSRVQGGILQGLGHAVMEERVMDPTTGAAAIVNAFAHGTGVRPRAIPFTPARVLEAVA